MTEVFGRTGVRTSRLALGALSFGTSSVEHHHDSVRTIHAALDAGITYVDTSDNYQTGESERVVGQALAGGRRDRVFLATKFFRQSGDDVNRRGGSRRWIMTAVEESLRRLDVDHLDLYQAHRPDPDADPLETLAALEDLVTQGKIRYYGTSNFEAHEIVEAQHVAAARLRTRPVSEQAPYSLLVRGSERAVWPVVEQYGVAGLAWGPLAGGWLSGAFRTDVGASWSERFAALPHRADPDLPENRAKARAVVELTALADEAGLPLIHLALAFVLRHPAVTAAVIGPRTPEQLETHLGALDVWLEDDLLDRIDAIVAPGTDLNPADRAHLPRSLRDAGARRRTPTTPRSFTR